MAWIVSGGYLPVRPAMRLPCLLAAEGSTGAGDDGDGDGVLEGVTDVEGEAEGEEDCEGELEGEGDTEGA
jgi:hypothetical protein